MAELPHMYTDMARWFHLLTPPVDYEEESATFVRTIEEHARREIAQVLELGSGGGNNASHLKKRFTMTLVDLSPEMLDVSRSINPELEHLEGDMRTVRLGRDFDAVLIHDAIIYMTTEEDLASAVRTASDHLRPGGVGLFVPDETAETYRPRTYSGGEDQDDRGIRYLQWMHEPVGTTYSTTFVYALREQGTLRVDHEEHVAGLFPRATWARVIVAAGLEPFTVPYEHSEFGPGEGHVMFVGVKP